MIQRYGTQVSPNGDTLVYHEHGSWVKYSDHTAAIQELREALEEMVRIADEQEKDGAVHSDAKSVRTKARATFSSWVN